VASGQESSSHSTRVGLVVLGWLCGPRARCPRPCAGEAGFRGRRRLSGDACAQAASGGGFADTSVVDGVTVDQADQIGIDAAAVAVGGMSAGGGLAAAVASPACRPGPSWTGGHRPAAGQPHASRWSTACSTTASTARPAGRSPTHHCGPDTFHGFDAFQTAISRAAAEQHAVLRKALHTS
jgi:hypothetical protein